LPPHFCISGLSLFFIDIAKVRAHRLLGWSAFAGYLVLAAGWPLNSFIVKRSIKIQKGRANARDKRMQVINELIGAVSFIDVVRFLLLQSLKISTTD
jgi:hypothetical protein